MPSFSPPSHSPSPGSPSPPSGRSSPPRLGPGRRMLSPRRRRKRRRKHAAHPPPPPPLARLESEVGDRYAKKKKLNNKIRHGLLGLPPSPQPPRERAGAESRTTAPSLPRRPVAGLLPPRRSAHGRPARPPPWLGQEPSESRPACCSRRGGGCGGGSPPALTVRLRGRRASQGGRAGGGGKPRSWPGSPPAGRVGAEPAAAIAHTHPCRPLRSPQCWLPEGGRRSRVKVESRSVAWGDVHVPAPAPRRGPRPSRRCPPAGQKVHPLPFARP